MSMSSAPTSCPTRTCRALAEMLGKGYLLPAPVLPREAWRTSVLPTPMAVGQSELPIAAIVYDPQGNEVLRRPLGRLPRGRVTRSRPRRRSRHGSARRRLRPRRAGLRFLGRRRGRWLAARDLPLSRTGDRPCRRDQFWRACLQHHPDLSRRAAILRRPAAGAVDPAVPAARRRRLRHVVPSDLPGLAAVAAGKRHRNLLCDGSGREIARAAMAIPCSGSRLWRYHALFDAAERARAPAPALTRSSATPTCRLFGYHGLLGGDGAFSLDHMFGF